MRLRNFSIALVNIDAILFCSNLILEGYGKKLANHMEIVAVYNDHLVKISIFVLSVMPYSTVVTCNQVWWVVGGVRKNCVRDQATKKNYKVGELKLNFNCANMTPTL